MTSRKTEDETPAGPDLSRRGFIKSWGAGAVAATIGGGYPAQAAEAEDQPLAAEERNRVELDVNGRPHSVLAEPRWSLLHVLREELGLTGCKPGCERGECGACTVLLDDAPHYACQVLAVEAAGRRIETVEGLLDGETLSALQAQFVKEDGLQCGYCTPGQVMAAEGLLRRNPDPSAEEIRSAMSGNLCRCGAYAHIFNAVAAAAKARKG